jgi:hypothetical protein
VRRDLATTAAGYEAQKHQHAEALKSMPQQLDAKMKGATATVAVPASMGSSGTLSAPVASVTSSGAKPSSGSVPGTDVTKLR